MPPYWPWLQALRPFVRSGGIGAPTNASAPAPFDLPALFTERARRAEGSPSAPEDPAHADFPLFEAVGRLLEAAAKTEPLVLVLEDLHAADLPSLSLLRFLCRELRAARLLWVATCQDSSPRELHVAELLSRLGREGHRLPLAPWTPSEVAACLRDVWDLSPAESASRAIHEATGGHPSFVDDVVRMLAASGRLDHVDDLQVRDIDVPETVRVTILRRLESLPELCREVLATAAVIGLQFDLPSLQRACDLPMEQVVELLEKPCALGVVRRSGSVAGRYVFVHALACRTIYEALPAAERIARHRRIGLDLEEKSADRPESYAELARHFFQVAGAGEVERAISYAAKAGEHAARRLAEAEAASHYESALQAYSLREPPDERMKCDLLLSLGDARRKLGQSAKAADALARAAGAARRVRAPDLFARAALGLALARQAEEGSGPLGEADTGVGGMLEEALEGLPAHDRLRPTLLGRLAATIHGSAEAERRERLAAQAEAEAVEAGDSGTLCRALLDRTLASCGPHDLERRLEWTRGALRLAAETNDREAALTARQWLVMHFLERGDDRAARHEIDAHASLAAQTRQPLHLAQATVLRGMRAILEGRLADAETLARDALRTPAGGEGGAVAARVAAQSAWILVERGELERVEPVIRSRAERRPADTAARAILAWISAELGSRENSRVELERFSAHRFADVPRDASWLPTMTFLGSLCALLQDPTAAAPLYDALLPFDGRSVVVGPPPTLFLGPVSYTLGLLAVAAGRLEAAIAHFERSVETADRMGARPAGTRARLAYAALLSRHPLVADRASPSQLVADALATARELGLGRLATKAETLRMEIGASGNSFGRPPEQPPVERVASVFRKEGDLWTIAAGAETVRVKDMVGLRYLALLVGDPGREFHVADLVTTVRGGSAASSRKIDPGIRHRDLGDAGEILDSRARREYRRRLDDLRDELEEARSFNDSGRAARAEEEMELLAQQLAAAVGLGGRDRKSAAASERARLSVCRAIGYAIAKVADRSPALGKHLSGSVRTGLFCSYEPDPDSPIRFAP